MTSPPRTLVKMPKISDKQFTRNNMDAWIGSPEAVVSWQDDGAYHKALADHHASVEAALLPYLQHHGECDEDYGVKDTCTCGLDDLMKQITEARK